MRKRRLTRAEMVSDHAPPLIEPLSSPTCPTCLSHAPPVVDLAVGDGYDYIKTYPDGGAQYLSLSTCRLVRGDGWGGSPARNNSASLVFRL
ncbi:MAG: hypothetical protein M3R15_12680 [Acidobacteriota bacterium]|nr:hypothetical protein [Acidobacteriota bacterium]